MRTVADAVIEQLRDAGVDHVFGLHGAHLEPLFQSCRRLEMPLIDTRHEAAAGHAAEGYARCTGNLGVALVTAGGGFTNALTPIVNAYWDRTPVLFITASEPRGDEETNTLQGCFDQMGMARPVTKWAHRVSRGDNVPRLLAQAIRIARAQPTGPVVLDIPMDVMGAPLGDMAILHQPETLSAPGGLDEDAINLILEAFKAAKRPVIIAGPDVTRGNRGAQLRQLAEATGAPVFSDYEGLGAQHDMPESLARGLMQYLFSFSTEGCEPDFVLLLGVRFSVFTLGASGRLIPQGAKVIQIDSDAGELGKIQSVSHGIVASVACAVSDLAKAADQASSPDRSAWQETSKAVIRKRDEIVQQQVQAGKSNEFHPMHASTVLASRLTGDTQLVMDGALTWFWMNEALRLSKPRRLLCHSYLGSMGYGFGVAIGAQVAAAADRVRTVLVTGDGALGLSLAEFDTLARHRIPLIVVVMNNRAWGTAHCQTMVGDRDMMIGTNLDNGGYHAVAGAFNVPNYIVEDAEAFGRALDAAMLTDGPCCINVIIDMAPSPPEEQIMMGLDPFA